MVKILIPKRFSKEYLKPKTLERFGNVLGPITNFYGAETVEYLNMRIFIKDNQKSFKIVNDYNNKFNYILNQFVRSFFRTFSDGIITNDSHVMKNREDNFEIDYDEMQLDRETYFSITPRLDNKKPIGIMSSDLNKNMIHKHKLFLNENLYKYVLLKKEKYDKFKDKLDSKMMNTEIIPVDYFDVKEVLDIFKKETNSKLTFMEGFGDLSLKYLQFSDPDDIPSDILILAFVKDGDYDQSELSRPFDIWNRLERNYVKLYQTKKLMGEDGSSRFFSIFKKRMLIQKHREVFNLENENPLFDESTFKNYF